jgi:membrane protein implicated in regulation of membrane protease activity
MSFLIFLLAATQVPAANLTGQQLKLGLITLVTFLILSMTVTWMFKKWVKINKEDAGDQ